MSLIALFIALVFLHSLVSARLERTIVTAPIVFTATGMMAFQILPELRGHQNVQGLFLRVAEIGLVLLLFTDASRTDLRVLKNIRNLPARLLSSGMLLTIVLGAARFSHAVDLGSGHPGRYSRSNRCRPGANHRQQPARAHENSTGS